MGFKKIKHEDLQTKSGFNLIGLPLSQTAQTKDQYDNKGLHSGFVQNTSDISIVNEEVLDFQYYYDRSRKSSLGYGNLSVRNNSVKDRIWDAFLVFSGSKYTSIGEENEAVLGIFEPKISKSVKYDFINTEEISDLMRVDENIEIINDKIDSIQIIAENSEESTRNLKRINILLAGRENLIKYTIVLKNVSSSIIEEIELRKALFKDFYDFQVPEQTTKNLVIKRNSLEWAVNELHPGEKAILEFSVKVMPNKTQKIRTGTIESSYKVKDNVVSDVNVKKFSAFSHAFHAIDKEEVDNKPNHWICSLVFENHSSYLMDLKSILVTDKSKIENYVKLDFENSNNKTLINSGESYETNEWEVKSEKEPSFFRKLEYSVNYKYSKNSTIKIQFADDVFEVVGYKIEKVIPRTEIKSFEESVINNSITISNNSSIPIYGFIVEEVVPEDFLLPMESESYSLTNNSGKITSDSYSVTITPNNEDPSMKHVLKLEINLSQKNLENSLEMGDTLEIKYPLKAISPDNKKSYDFPIEVNAYYSKYQDNTNEEFHVIKEDLDRDAIPSLNIAHKRRKIMIGKEVFPGRSSDEFAINIMIKNRSNASIKDVDISDTFPGSFKLISSNITHKMTKSDDNGQMINFTIPNIAPYQEMEIMYYLKTLDGNDVNYTELESYFYG